MAPPLSSKQRLALAVCHFLSTSTTDGTLTAEDSDSIDVAVNCIAESFKIDPTDNDALQGAIGNQSLLQIYAVYEKLKGGSASSSSASASASSSSAPAAGAGTTAPDAAGPASPNTSREPSDAQKKEAEALKSRGNAAMAQKDYPAAIDLYTQALELHNSNAVFLSNRAAAHSANKDHASAMIDAEAAVAIDPSYTKAWSRLGLARFALGDPRGAMDAYRQGIEHEGNGGSEAMKKGFETAKRRVDELDSDSREDGARAGPGPSPGAGSGLPDLSSLAGMFGGGGAGAGAGGGAGGGGMPDLSSIMNNPMFASMAQNVMSNPELMSNIMNNPRLREMASNFTNGGGMPDFGALLSDPNLADMARNMLGGGGTPNGPRR